MEGFSSPVASGTFTSINNADDEGSSSGSEIDELAQAMSTVHIRRRGRHESNMQCTPQSAIRPRKRIDVSEGMDEGKDEDKENIPGKPVMDEDTHVTTPKATPSRLDRITQLREELTCSVCLEVCTRPCTTPCGHSFCRSCLRASLAHSSKCAKCREALPRGYLPKINTALWNTIQLLFPSEAAAGPPVTPNPEAPLQPSNRPNTSGFRLNSHLVQGSRPATRQAGTGHPILTNPFRPPWQQRQQIHAPNRDNNNDNSSSRSSRTGGHGSRLAELLDQVEGAGEEQRPGSSQEGAGSRVRPAPPRAPLRHHPQQSSQVNQQVEANPDSGLGRGLLGSQRQQQQQQQQRPRPRQRLPGAPRWHLLSAQRDQPQEQGQEHRLQRWQQWQQLQQGRDQAAADTAHVAAHAGAEASAAACDAGASLRLSACGRGSGHAGLVGGTAQAAEVAESTAGHDPNPDPAALGPAARAPASANPFVRSIHYTTVQPPHCSASAAPSRSVGSHRAAAAPPPPPPPPALLHPQLHPQPLLSQRLCGQLLQPPRSPESPPCAADPERFSTALVHNAAAGGGGSEANSGLAPCPHPCRQRRRVQHGDEEATGKEGGAETAHCDGVDGAGGESGDSSLPGSNGAHGLASAPGQSHMEVGIEVGAGVVRALRLSLGGAVEQDMGPAPPGSRNNPIEILSSDTDGDKEEGEEEEEQGCPGERDPRAAAEAVPPPLQPALASIALQELTDQGSLGPGRTTRAHVQQQDGGLHLGSSNNPAPARTASVPHSQRAPLHPWVVPGMRRPNSSGSTSIGTGSTSTSNRPVGMARSTLARSTLAGCSGAAVVPGLRKPRPRNQD